VGTIVPLSSSTHERLPNADAIFGVSVPPRASECKAIDIGRAFVRKLNIVYIVSPFNEISKD
jgi:hypothetical protein